MERLKKYEQYRDLLQKQGIKIQTELALHIDNICRAMEELENNVTQDMEVKDKRPAGLRPKHILDDERLNEVAHAITRYHLAGLTVPKNWTDEYNELAEKIGERNLTYGFQHYIEFGY